MSDVTPPPAPATTPLWEDLVDVVISPTAVFARRKEDPRFFVAMLILTVLFGVLVFASWDLTEDVRRAESSRQIERMLQVNPNMPAEQQEQMRARVSGGGVGKFLGGLAVPLMVLFVGLYTWIGAKVGRAKTNFGQAYMVTTLAMVPKLIGVLISALLMVVLPEAMRDGQFRLTLGPGMFIDPDSMRQSVLFFFARFDVTTLWTTFLIGLGIKVTGEVSTQKAALAAVVVFFLGYVLMGGLIMLGEMAMGLS
jgi:hypothetical protein